jgi:HK97 family phage major capsid protein
MFPLKETQMSAKLKELREARGKAVADARAILDKADAEKRSVNKDEDTAYTALFTKQEELRGQIEREERQVEVEREAASAALRSRDALRDGGAGRAVDPEARGAHDSDEYRAAFSKLLTQGARSLSEAETRALQADSDTAGGFTVAPQQFVNQLIKNVDDLVFIRQRATKFRLATSDSMGAPSLAADPADADWTTELATGSEDSTMSFGKRELNPHPLAKRLKVSNKLLRLVSGTDALVRDRLAYKFAISQEKAFMTGSGSNQPLGLFTASANGVTTARDVSTDNTATSVTMDGLLNTKYSLKGQYWNRADWIFHRDAMKQISKLKDGEGQYLWRESVRDGEPDRLLGRPIMMSEYAPNTFTTGLYVGILGDFSNYWIADAVDMQVQVLKELYAETNQTGYIGRLSTDGMPILAESFARVKLG